MRIFRMTRGSKRLVVGMLTFGLMAFGVSEVEAAKRKSSRPKSVPVNVEPPTTRELRFYQADWMAALKEYRAGDYREAAQRFEALPEGDELAALYRSFLLAQSRLRLGDTVRADAALAAALTQGSQAKGPARVASGVSDVVWVRALYRLRLRTSTVLQPSERKTVLLAALRSPLDNNAKVEALHGLLGLDSSLLTQGERITFARQLVSLGLPGARLDREYRRWSVAYPVAAGADRGVQKLLLDWEEKLGLWESALMRSQALLVHDSAEEFAKPIRSRIPLLHYNMGSYEKSIQEYLSVRTRYGESPEILIQIARGYRALSQDAPSQAWYTRLVERFPRDSRAAETLWMRAFEDEMLGKPDTALAAYARIARDFPQHARSGEALFRAGLVEYRRGNFAPAQRSFSELRLAQKSGRLTGAAHYWEGKSLAALGLETDARQAWATMARDYPFGHYGHLARQELQKRGALPDSLTWKRLLNAARGDSIRAWFAARGRGTTRDSGSLAFLTSGSTAAASGTLVEGQPVEPGSTSSHGFERGFGESVWLPVERLFDMGLDTLAVFTLQARANADPSNLWLVYDAAVRCRTAGFGYEAYRFALRLSDKLPLQEWPAAPLEVLRLFYPPSYIELVRPEATRNEIPQGLALALIKQESGFDPNAVSRVGARGLMQLMPTTGREQARKIGMKDFHPDSLFVPAINIKLGVSYLRDVIKRHNGNIDYALAHYNAGPTALARWMPRLEGRPLEEAVEDIGYAETREYVKRVGANYRTYQVLWEGK